MSPVHTCTDDVRVGSTSHCTRKSAKEDSSFKKQFRASGVDQVSSLGENPITEAPRGADSGPRPPSRNAEYSVQEPRPKAGRHHGCKTACKSFQILGVNSVQ